MLEGTPQDVNLEGLLEEVETLPEVRAVTQFCIWSLNGEEHVVRMHMMINEGIDAAVAKEAVRIVLAKSHVVSSAIEIDGTEAEHERHNH
jgi:Co/Zn/Cd efflux system component